MDPTAAPAEDLSTLYAQRWEVETIFDELKTHQRGPKVVLRSKTPTASAKRPTATCACTTPCAP